MKNSIPIVIIVSLATTVGTLGLWSGGIQTQQKINTVSIGCLRKSLETEKDARKDGQEETNIKLAEINVNLEYIKKAVTGKE